MVLKKKLSYGFNGFLVPDVPRAPRSIRRTTHKRTAEESQVCAFELLASLAGKLLQESESSASSNASEGNDQPVIDKDGLGLDTELKEKSLKTECLDQESGEVSVARSESVTSSSLNLKEFPHAESHFTKEHTSKNTHFACLKESHDWKFHEGMPVHGNFTGKMELGLPSLLEPFGCKMENGSETEQEIKSLDTGALTKHPNEWVPKETTEQLTKFPSSLNCNKDVKLHLGRSPFPNASFSKHRNDTKLGIRDDDEKFYRFNKFKNRFKTSRPPTRIVDRRIRKLLASSKYWKAAPKLNDFELSRADGGARPHYRKRKNCYNFERNYYNVIYKKRKFCDPSSVLTSDRGVSSESVSNLPEKNGEKSYPSMMLNGGASFTGHQAARHAKDSHVKFSIKSFRIPELFIEVPETATVGSLKRTVVEAVTALFGDGIRVGVLLQGKKVRDDNRTLSQTGISCKDNLDTLGFTLEPNPAQAPPVCGEGHPLPLLGDANPDLSRCFKSQFLPAVDLGPPKALPEQHILTSIVNHVDSNPELVSSHADKPIEESLPESKALVPVPPMNVEALAVVPVKQQKIRKSELAQRRTRRPFSVPEVEALVQAVEELGTGRWRDVKLRAFENADHRTYVDLKDKWKTLVHTARISPQQRRGEPVPQELLDRVLAAHAYWSQHQAKQQGKLQGGRMALEMCK